MKKLHFILSIAILVLVGFGVTSKANASGTANLTGWGWSSNIGWISFSSANAGQATGGVGYNVTLATTTGSTIGNFGGWAWSSNVGWIKFAGDGTSAHTNPTVDLSTGIVSGWARVCAGTVNKDCTGADRTDGWDGWIELAGSGHPTGHTDGSQGITFDPVTGKFNGYAWGDVNVGWLTFGTEYTQGNDVVICPNNDCGWGEGGSLGGSCNGTAGTNSATWTVNPTGGTSYTYSWNGAASTTNNTFEITGTGNIPGPTVTAASSDGKVGSYSCSNVQVGTSQPGIKMWFRNPSGTDTGTLSTLKIRTGQNATINWQGIGGTAIDADSCVGNLNNQGTGAQSAPDLSNGVSTTIVRPTRGVYRFSMHCNSNGDPVSALDSTQTKNYLELIVTNSLIEEI